MSAVPKSVLHPIFEDLLQPIAPKSPRMSRQQFIESEIVEFRPDYTEAMEMLDSIEVGLNVRFNDDVGVDVTHLFKRLREALDEADTLHHRKTYDPRDQYNGPEDDFPFQPK